MIRYMLETILVVGPAAVLLGFIIYGSFDSWQAVRRSKLIEKPSMFVKVIEPQFRGGLYFQNCYPGYKDGKMSEVKRLAYYEDVEKINKKFDLLLSHIKLEYVPETEKKEPAKFIKTK